MTAETIDYDNYTEKELTDALSAINAEVFPAEYAALLAALNKRRDLAARQEEANSTASEPSTEKVFFMPSWLKTLLLISSLGGGFAGFSIALMHLLKPNPVLGYIMIMLFIALYALGVFAGLRLAKRVDHTALEALKLYWTLQIPIFMSPIAGYQAGSGLVVNIWYSTKQGFEASFAVGSNFVYSLFQSFQPWAIGINLFAFIMLIFLRRVQKENAVVSSSGNDF